MLRIPFLALLLASGCQEVPAPAPAPVEVADSRIHIGPFDLACGPRFIATKTPTELLGATAVYDLVPEDAHWEAFNLTHIALTDLRTDSMWTAPGSALSPTMRDVLAQLPVSGDYRIGATDAGELHHPPTSEPFNVVYYVSVVPEQQAAHPLGLEGVARAVRDAIAPAVEATGLDEYDVRAGKLRFTVDASGQISSSEIESSCGFPHLDAATHEALLALPATWSPARNASGFPVSQTLYLSFGSLGC